MSAKSFHFQQSLIDELPRGFRLFRGMVEPRMQIRMVELVRDLCRVAPLIQPVTRFGRNFNLQITSWGNWGWISTREGYRYVERHPETNKPWPAIPPEVKNVMLAAAREAGYPKFDLQSVLVNFYPRGTGSLGRHQDKTEKNLKAPITTISLGESCIFGMGGQRYDDPLQEVAIDSGDVLVQGGPARSSFHEVIRLLPGSSGLLKQGGRISFTGRTYI